MAVTKIVRSAVFIMVMGLLRGRRRNRKTCVPGRRVQSGLSVSQLHTGMKTATVR